MEKKKKRSLEEIFKDLKEAEKEFDEKLDKYGLKEVKPKKEEVANEPSLEDGAQDTNQSNSEPQTSNENQDA